MLSNPELLHHLILTCQQITAQARARAGITQSEYAALHHLTHRRKGLTPGELGSALALTSGSITKLVDRLETRNLAHRIRQPTGDRRSITIQATPQGQKLIQNDLEQLAKTLQGDAPPLTPQEQATIARLLAAIDTPEQSD